VIRLSFDDGPSKWTPQILDVLFEYDVQATFFVIGQHIAAHEETLERMVDEGHTVGNHTWSHPRLTDLGEDRLHFELKNTQDAFLKLMGFKMHEWRAPYFATDERVDAIAADLGLNPEQTGADVVPDDWMLTDGDEIARRVLHGLSGRGNQGVVCLHDGIPPDGGSSRCTDSRQPTVDAVKLILEALA